MNYYPKAHSPAINWGVYNEPFAIANFLKAQRGFHKHMKGNTCGVFVCAQYPFIAASPDAIVGLLQSPATRSEKPLQVQTYVHS